MAAHTNDRTRGRHRHRAGRGGAHLSEFDQGAGGGSTYARYIGRVGALAVALGVGAAAATGYGVGLARADDDPGTNGSAAAAGTPSESHSPGSGEEGVGPVPQSGSPDPDTGGATVDNQPASGMNVGSSGGPNTSVNDEGQSTDDAIEGDDEDAAVVDDEAPPTTVDQTPTPIPETSPPPTTGVPAPPAPASQDDSGSGTATDKPQLNLTTVPGDDTQPSSTPQAGSPMMARTSFLLVNDPQDVQTLSDTVSESKFSTLVDTADMTPQGGLLGLPGALINIATSIVAALLSPFIGTGPSTPAEPPLLWAMLAFVRREISRAFFNRTPDAIADYVTTGQEDTTTVIDVLANDGDDDDLTITSVVQSTNGTVTINPNGTLTYKPKANFAGDDTFTYTVTDQGSPFHLHGFFGFFGGGHTDTGTVTVKVASVNDAAVADNDSYSVSAGGTLEVTAADGVLNGDIDIDNTSAQLSAVLGTGPAHGTLTLNSNGSFTYKPAANFNGVDSFTYHASDGAASSNVSTVSITVAPGVETGPVAEDPAFTIDTINRATGAMTGRVHASDVDGDELKYTLESGIDRALGTVEVDSTTGAFTFTPTTTARLNAWSATGERAVTFTVTVSDGELESDITVIASISSAARSVVANITGAEQESWGNQGLAVGPDGRYYMTTYMVDGTVGEVVVLNADGTYATTVNIAEAISYPFVTAYDVAVGPDGRVFVSGEVGETAEEVGEEAGRGIVVLIDPTDDYAVTLFADLDDPASAIAVDSSGLVYVSNWNNDAVTVLNSDGSLHGAIESAELVEEDDSGVAGLALGPNALLYLTKPQLGVVKVVNPDGSTARTFAVGGEPWAITVGGNGIVYVADFNDTRVVGLDATGAVVRTIGLGNDASPSDVVATPDGRVYVSYMTANGGKIAIIDAVPVAEPDATAIGDPIAGLPVTVGSTGAPVVATDVIYQTVTGTDTDGKPVTMVAVIGADGETTFARVGGEAFGSLVLGSDDVAYQTVRKLDAATDIYETGVLLVTPGGEQVFSGWFAGDPAGTVVFGGADAAYQVVSTEDESTGGYTTTVLKISAAGVTPYRVSGYSGGLASTDPHGLVAGPDGTLYLTTTDTPAGATGPVTTVTVVKPTGISSFTIDGIAGGPATIANGSVLLTVGRFDLEPGAEDASFTAVVAVLTDAGFEPLPETIDGMPMGSPVVAADGAVYQPVVKFVVGTETSAPNVYTVIAVVTADGLAPVFESIPGTPFDADGSFMPIVAGPEGSIYQTTYGFADPSGTGDPATLIAGLSSAGEQFGAVVSGAPVGTVVPGIGGFAYQTTYDANTDTTRVSVISLTGSAVHDFDGYPGNPMSDVSDLTPVVVTADGTAYLTLSTRDPITLEYTTTVAIITPDNVISQSVNGFPSGHVFVAPDGTVYLTVGVVDFEAQAIFTDIVAVTPDGLNSVGAVIRGNPVGPGTSDSDGRLYQAVVSDDGTGSSMTTVHVVDPSAVAGARMAAGFARSVAALSFTSPYTYTIDDAYLAPFNAADPTGRFYYTQNINDLRGTRVDFPPISDADLVKYVNDYIGYTGTGSDGFARDAQGRITYRNTTSQDVLVVYGPRPDRPAQGALLARPGATVVLPAGPEGRVAGAGAPGQMNWIAVAYRGATVVPTTRPKTGIVLASTHFVSHGMTTVDMAARLPNSDEVKIEIVENGNVTRMVVYMGGVIPPDLNKYTPAQVGPSWIEAYSVRYRNSIPSRVSTAINKAVKDFNPSEIMLVGHSKGGMIAQNYAEYGQYKDRVKVIVTYGSPIIKWPSFRYSAIHLRDAQDLINVLHDGYALITNGVFDQIYDTPPTNESDKHSMGNYKKVAQNFEWDSKWTGVKQRMATFGGDLVTTYPLTIRWGGGGGVGFA